MVTLIFLHGGPGLPDYLEQVFAGKFGTEIETVFYSQSQSGVKSIDDLLKELDGHVAHATTPIVLVGHSWGAMLAAEYVFRGNRKIAGLILISGAYAAEYKGKGEELLRRLRKNGSKPIDCFLTFREQKDWQSWIETLLSKENSAVYRSLNDSYMKKFDNEANFRNPKLPILNIYGDTDFAIATSHERKLGQLSDRIRNLEICDAGHFPFLAKEDRTMVVQAIVTFVKQALVSSGRK